MNTMLRFDVRCPANLDTVDLEAEIFLHLLHNYQSFVLGNPDVDGAKVAATFLEGEDCFGLLEFFRNIMSYVDIGDV